MLQSLAFAELFIRCNHALDLSHRECSQTKKISLLGSICTEHCDSKIDGHPLTSTHSLSHLLRGMNAQSTRSTAQVFMEIISLIAVELVCIKIEAHLYPLCTNCNATHLCIRLEPA